jgi:molybdenum cofactor cytidylyltransferase
LKNIPEGAKRSLVLNQVGAEDTLIGLMRVAKLLRPNYDSITICSLKTKTTWVNIEAAAGVLLAAGGARRYGEPKLLLPWRGKPLVRHAAETALEAGLNPLIVVVGALEEQLRAALAGLPVQILPNAEWQQGQSTSVKAGIHAVPQACGSAVFLLGDQPGVTPELITALVERHQRSLAPVIAPHVGGRRTNPVLFDRSTFADFEMIEGDIGGRAIFQKHGMEMLEWDDPTLLLDIDTPDDYEMLRKLE